MFDSELKWAASCGRPRWVGYFDGDLDPGLPADALQDALHGLRPLADGGADRAVGGAAGAHALHALDDSLLVSVRDQPADLAGLHDIEAEGPLAAREHALSRQVALGIARRKDKNLNM
jgi:hypothetical protein